MKKILLGTSTLISAAALFAGAAFAAETPKVTIGGTSDFQFGWVDEDLDTNLREGAFRQETEVNIKIDAKTDSGLGYGGQIDVMLSGNSDQDNNVDAVNRSWVYLDGAWGRLEGGTTYGVTHTMKVDAASIARATGGIDGDFTFFMSGSAPVIATPDLALDYGINGGSNLGNESQEGINKINYYTPRFAGFQAGVSFLFDTTGFDRGIVLSRTDNTVGEAENVVLGGINYDNKFGDVAFAAAVTGEWGNSESAATEDLRTWNAGLKLGYMGWSLAGSYGNLGDSLQAIAIGDDTHYWTAGVAYETGPFGVSVTYLDSTRDVAAGSNDFQNISVGADYKLAPGFTPYVDVSFIELDAATAALDNDATVAIVGTQLAF
jgi:outer membrane protein OmpU